MHLEKFEKETIIVFNEEEPQASIFTYNKAWQRRLEKDLGLCTVMQNEAGGKEYFIDKDKIKMPNKPRSRSSKG